MIKEKINEVIKPILKKYGVDVERLHRKHPPCIKALYEIYLLGCEFTTYYFIKTYINPKVPGSYKAIRNYLEYTSNLGDYKGNYYEEEEKILLDGIAAGESVKEMAKKINRSYSSVKTKIYYLKRNERMQTRRVQGQSI